MTPKLLLESLKKSQSFFFLRDTILPFPLSKDTTSIIYKMYEMQVYFQNDRPSYVVSVPLVNKGEFKVYHIALN